MIWYLFSFGQTENENVIFAPFRSFKDSDGDGIGDLNGITSKLEHLKEIGIDGVWLSPIFKVFSIHNSPATI